MKRGEFDVGAIESISNGARHIFCIAINVRQFTAIIKGLLMYIFNATANGNGGQVVAITEYIKY